MSNEAAVAAVRALEAERIEAMIAKDLAKLERLLAPTLVYTHSNALVDTRTSYLEGIKSGKFDYRKVDTSDVTFQSTADAVVVTGRAVIQLMAPAGMRTLNNRFCDVWLKGASGWQMVAWESTPIPAG